MAMLILFVAMLAILTVAAALGKTPDTHREVTQHGDFRF
jgi:hypothetical protein